MRTPILDQFTRKLQSVPEIVDAWYVTSDYDFALRIVARDMESFETMTSDVLYADNFVKNFKTLVTMRAVKVQGSIRQSLSPARRPIPDESPSLAVHTRDKR